MPMCHGNSGKYVSKRFEELRVQAYNDLTVLSDTEKDFAETFNMPITSVNGVGQFEIMTQPMAWYDSPGGKLIDARTLRDKSIDTEQPR
jgi:hypothetical protein